MKICPLALLPLAVITAMLFFFAGAGFCEEKPTLYSNEDIEQYRSPSDKRSKEQIRAAPSVKSVTKDESKRSREKQDQDYWCKRATTAKKKIEHAGHEVREREEDISREQSKKVQTSGKIKTLQSRLEKAKYQLSSAERDLNDIENEAHKKGIRPGWLRCQFD